MFKNITLLNCLLFGLSSYANEIDLKSVYEHTLKNNFDVNIQLLKKEESTQKALSQLSQYDFGLNLSYSHVDANTPSSSSLDGSGSAASVESLKKSWDLTLSKTFYYTGTEITLPYGYDISESGSIYQIFPKSHQPSFGATISQPLLKPFVSGALDKKHRVSIFDEKSAHTKANYEIDEKTFKSFDLFLRYQEEKAKLSHLQQSLETTRKTLAFTQQKKNIGRASIIDVLNAQTKLIKARERVISTDQRREKYLGQLRVSTFGEINEQEFQVINDEWISKVSAMPLDIELIRGDLKSKKILLEKAIFEQKVAKADFLPDWSIELDFTFKGLSDSFDTANKEVWNQDYITYNVGTTLDYNLIGYARDSNNEIKNLKTKQAALQFKKLEFEIDLEKKLLRSQIDSKKESLKAFKESVGTEKTKIGYYEKLFKAGKLPLLDYHKHLDEKLSVEIEYEKIKIGLLRSVMEFYKAHGQLKKFFQGF